MYLGAQTRDNVTLYRDLPSTQTALLPVLISGMWRLHESAFLMRLFAAGCLLHGGVNRNGRTRSVSAPLWNVVRCRS